jgi:hypothetical protein
MLTLQDFIRQTKDGKFLDQLIAAERFDQKILLAEALFAAYVDGTKVHSVKNETKERVRHQRENQQKEEEEYLAAFQRSLGVPIADNQKTENAT